MLIGYLDQVQATVVSGWAADTDAPDAIVFVAIYVDSQRIATVACDRVRQDLTARPELHGHSRHGFRFEPATPLPIDRIGRVTVRFAASGGELIDGQRVMGAQLALHPILVTAPGRSGTTFFMNRLSQSPRVCVVEVPPFEVRLMAYWAMVYRTLTAGPDFRRSTDPGHLEGDGFRVGSNPFAHSDYANAFSVRQLATDYFGTFVSGAMVETCRTIIQEYYLRLRDDQAKTGAVYFAEKGNNIHRPSRMISRIIFPELKEIIILRDPRDLYCSQLSYFRQGEEKTFSDISYACDELLRIWRAGTGNELFLKYEDMVLGEGDPYRKLSAFLDVPDLEHGDQEKETAVFRVHATSKSPTASIGRWRELPKEEADRCNTTWGAFLSEFHYVS